jgi:hypothetical protein
MAWFIERAHVGGLGVMALAIACGGGGGGTGGPLLADAGATSGIDESTSLPNLTSAQATLLCEWMATRMGGYDVLLACGSSGEFIASEPYSQCLSGDKWKNAPAPSDASLPPVCTATVSDAENCINGVVEQKPCTTFPSACIDLTNCIVGPS